LSDAGPVGPPRGRRTLRVGYYNRFDIFRLVVDQRPNRPITLIREESEAKRALHNESQPVTDALFASSEFNRLMEQEPEG